MWNAVRPILILSWPHPLSSRFTAQTQTALERQSSRFSMLRIVCGTYEGFLYGIHVSEDSKEAICTQQFGYRTHDGCVKSVSLSPNGKYILTGGMDDRIRIFDAEKKMEKGVIEQHTGDVTKLKFVGKLGGHALSASEDGTICIWRCRDWALLHILGGHKAGICGLDVHHSGRMALSVSKDRTLRLWNLVEGRPAFIKRLKEVADGGVRWSPLGTRFALVMRNTLQIMENAGATAGKDDSNCGYVHPCRINAFAWINDETVVTAGDNGSIYATGKDKCKRELIMLMKDCCDEGDRIRDLVFVATRSLKTKGERGRLVVITSQGVVIVWNMPSHRQTLKGGWPVLIRHSIPGKPRCVEV